MASARFKMTVGGLAIACALGYLGLTGVQAGWVYFVNVETFLKNPGPDGRRVRIHGTVGSEGLDARPADLVANFDLLGGGQRLRVEYRGAIPDLFQAGREVVVEGAMEGAAFRADVLMTKCSSKYEGHGESGPAPGVER